MLYRLPPVFNAVTCARSPSPASGFSALHDCHIDYYGSGTSALAAVLLAAKCVRNVNSPEVLIPAYTCPDVVSAALYAGIRPVLVDMEPDRPWLGLAEVEAAVTERTVAVVGINFLGIPERLSQLRALAEAKGLVLIEDSAQWYPDSNQHQLIGDARIYSFGRGKPVNLLGGGAALVRRGGLLSPLDNGGICPAQVMRRLIHCLKAAAFNCVTHPYLYWLLERLPVLHVGETRYHDLRDISCLPHAQWEIMAAGMRKYQDQAKQRRAMIASLDRYFDGLKIPGFINMPRACSDGELPLLLRYPLLFATMAQRDAVFERLDALGLGVSRLYRRVLPEVQDMPRGAVAANSMLVNARAFAGRLLTLPVHEHAAARLCEIAEVVLDELRKP